MKGSHVFDDCDLLVKKSKLVSNSYDTTAHAAASIVIFLASLLGVSLPYLGLRVLQKHTFDTLCYIGMCFGVGVILSTVCIHLIPGAFRHLTNPCTTQTYFGGRGGNDTFMWSGAFVLVSLFLFHLLDIVMR
eukprot:PhF_6_TR33864/c0_g1_i1/m.49689